MVGHKILMKKEEIEDGMSERLRTLGTQLVACELLGPFP
jgi:hypothetical protein